MVRQPPYIYTLAEIGQLLAAAHRLPCSYALRRPVYATLIGLLAATGLRVSEALDLRFDDLLPNAVLRIRQTKFAKSRLVPLHATSVDALTAYLQERQRVASADDHLFVSANHRRIPTPMASTTFQKVIRLAGIAPGRQRRPRLADLRHTFATRSLQRCAVRRESVARHLVALSTYPRSRQPRLHLLVPGGDPGIDDRHRHGRREPGCREVGMTPIAPLITDFLRDYLPVQRGYSPHTCENYAYAFRLLFTFAAERHRIRPSGLHLEHLDAQLILAFLGHIEVQRGVAAATRNARLAAVKAFMRYVEFRHPAALAQVRQILAIPRQAP